MSRKQTALLLNAALILGAGLLGYALTIYFDNQKPPNVQTVEAVQLPEFSFTDLSGKTHAVENFRGKIVLINFWATWCPPCVVEFPQLLKIAVNNPDRVVLIALSSDADAQAIHTFLQKQTTPTANVYIALDNQDVTLKIFGVTQLPETIVAGPGLLQQEKLVGAEWDPAVLQKIIDSL